MHILHNLGGIHAQCIYGISIILRCALDEHAYTLYQDIGTQILG